MNTTRYVVGHDVGTSGDKAVLCDTRGTVVGTAHEPYGLQQPRPGWVEQDGEELVAAVGRATRQLLAKHDVAPEQVLAIGISGQMFCVGAVDGHGAPLSPLLSWLDMRSTEQAAAIAAAFPDDQYERFGSVLTVKDIVPKILWLLAEAPAVKGAAGFVDCKDLVVARLTGRVATDHAGASAYLLYDLARHAWDGSAAASLGVPVEQLPEALDATAVVGGMLADVAREYGLSAGTPVVVGAGDVPAGQVGGGAARPGQAHLSLGTASYFGISLDQPLVDPGRRLALLGHVDPARRLLWAEMETGAGALAWWGRTLDLHDPDAVDRLAGSVDGAVDADVPLFAPWLTGERVPYWDDDARGAFVGLTLRHGPAELTRAVMEGICFQLRLVFDYATAFGVAPDTIRVVGGAGMGGVLPGILADVLDRTLLLVDDPQSAGARGAAFCALAASQGSSIDDLSDSVGLTRVIRPEHGPAPYTARFERFRRLRDALASVVS